MIYDWENANGSFSDASLWTGLSNLVTPVVPGPLDSLVLGSTSHSVSLDGPGTVAALTVTAGSTATLGGQFTASRDVVVQSGAKLVTSSGSTIATPAIELQGGTADLATLSGTTTVDFSAGSTLDLHDISGSHTVTGFEPGDALKLVGIGWVSMSGNVIKLPSGLLSLNAPPAGSAYTLVGDGKSGFDLQIGPQADGGDDTTWGASISWATTSTSTTAAQASIVVPTTENVYRFFDSTNGTHLFTADWSEVTSLQQSRPDMVFEGVGLQAITASGGDPNTVAVFRFFDTGNGTHFYTASTAERDAALATRPDLVYEPDSTFYEHAAPETGDVPVYRFFDSVLGTHFYATSMSEVKTITLTRPDMTNEGICFYMPGTSPTS